MKKTLGLILKLAFVGALLTFLAKRGFLSLSATQGAFRHWELILPAFLALFLNAFLCAIRWQWLLRAQGFRLSNSRVLQLSFVGNFFNLALPGAVSGDFVKAYYVANDVQAKRGLVFGSILFDRLAGLSALVLVSAFAMTLGYRDLSGTQLFKAIHIFVTVAAVVVVAFYTYLFLVHEDYDPLLLAFKRAEKITAKAGSLTRIYEGVKCYRTEHKTVLKVLAISVVVHILVCFSMVAFARALGDPAMSPLYVFVVVPLGLLVTAVPITPAGVGTGHAAFTALFHLIGSERGADAFSLFVLMQLVGGAIGGLIYLRFKSEGHGASLPNGHAPSTP